MKNFEPIADRGLAQIRSEYPQAHIVSGRHADLVTIPGFRLCSGWTADGKPADICTVLFERPAGFPAACPEHFFVDIPLRLADRSYAKNSRPGDIYKFPQWSNVTWFSWHLQMWDPNRDSLYTYLKVIHMRMKPAR
jgi:hypothetical protein